MEKTKLKVSRMKEIVNTREEIEIKKNMREDPWKNELAFWKNKWSTFSQAHQDENRDDPNKQNKKQ